MPMPINQLLIVDDDVEIRTTLSQVFLQMGYRVRVASDGFTALAQMREALPDVLLSDLHMPGMSGFELLSVVRRRLPEVYVIATSGAYQGDRVPDGIAADAFYQKASQFRTLLELVKGAMEPAVMRVRNAPMPQWVPRVVDAGTGADVGVISCPECLRAHRQALSRGSLVVHETACRDCGGTIRYAVVKELDPATSQPYLSSAEKMILAQARRGMQTGKSAPGRMRGPVGPSAA